jgi:hypothetical protein
VSINPLTILIPNPYNKTKRKKEKTHCQWSMWRRINHYWWLMWKRRDTPLCEEGITDTADTGFFRNLSFLKKIFVPLNCLINFIEKKIFNIIHNEIIMQIYQNIKYCRRKLSSSTWLSITLSFILLLLLIYKFYYFNNFFIR